MVKCRYAAEKYGNLKLCKWYSADTLLRNMEILSFANGKVQIPTLWYMIKMGITVINIVRSGVKSVLWSQIVFYGRKLRFMASLMHCRKTKFLTKKTTIYIPKWQLCHVMRKPVYAICEQQRRRSACPSTQSDQRLCFSLPGQYDISTCYSRNFKTLASLYSWAGWFESYLFEHPEDRFSRDEAQLS